MSANDEAKEAVDALARLGLKNSEIFCCGRVIDVLEPWHGLLLRCHICGDDWHWDYADKRWTKERSNPTR
jgi:hypothetical protein